VVGCLRYDDETARVVSSSRTSQLTVAVAGWNEGDEADVGRGDTGVRMGLMRVVGVRVHSKHDERRKATGRILAVAAHVT
jgi:hypothetical protein